MSSPASTALNLYADPSIQKDKVLKPLTAVPNPDAPQEGVHLYHFCGSLCSQKARLVLEEKGVPYEHHHVCIVGGVYDQYDPAYVRINSRCVVPTLVTDGKVTTDSHNIMNYVEEHLGNDASPRLMPTDPKERAAVQKFHDLGDTVALEPLTYGKVPGGADLPKMFQIITYKSHEKKAKTLKERIALASNDAYLKSAYEAKLKLVETNIDVLDSRMQQVVDATHSAIAQLNQQLVEGPASDGTSWLCGKNYSLADIQWAVVLFRLQTRGLDSLFWVGQYPAVEAYAERLFERPAFQRAVAAWQSPAVIARYIVGAKLSKHKTKFLILAGVMAALAWQRRRS